MNRRQFFRTAGTGAGIILSGCLRSGNQESTTTVGHNKVMNILSKVQNTSDGWLLEVTVVNEYPKDTSLHNINILGYDENGSKVCEVEVGDLLEPTEDIKRVETTCSKFPTIITATADESPCKNGLIPIIYWVGTDAQKTRTATEEKILWKSTYRKCGEKLPPERILDKFKTSSKENK